MYQQEIKELLQKYLCKQLSKSEIERLKTMLDDVDETSLDENLRELWEAYTIQGKRNSSAFSKVSHELKGMIQPQKNQRLLLNVWRGVAAVLIPLLLVATTYLYIDRKSMQAFIAADHQIVVEKGERATLTLPDGTRVYLNAHSSLIYPASFAFNNRIVQLSGEAYFEVTHDTKRPFIVETKDASVKVHGTTFNVYAYPEDSLFEASLVAGRIEVIPNGKPDESVLLLPNQKAGYNIKTGVLDVTNTDLRIETAWRRGDLIFRSQPLESILAQLEVFYGVTIHTAGTCPGGLFTGSFHEDEIGPVLINLHEHYNFTFQRSGGNVYIKFNK